MATILFDIVHPADVNFFKQSIYSLEAAGHRCVLSYVDRGIIARLLDKELPRQEKHLIGQYRKGTLPKIGMVAERLYGFRKLFRSIKPDVTTGFGNFPIAMASCFQGKPCVSFYDDFEFILNFRLSELFATKLIVPDFIPATGRKIAKYHSFKELAYLHPEHYKSNADVVVRAGLEPDAYVFVREVANISMNYTHLEENGLLEPIKYLQEKGQKVLLSLEDKSLHEVYAPYCEILEEPLEDIYSLIAGAKFMLASGDSMIREAALLGVPAIYTGGREMCVNTPFIEWGGVISASETSDVIGAIETLLKPEVKANWQKEVQGLIKESLENTSDVVESAISQYCS